VCKTRADGLGLTVKVGDESTFEYGDDVCGVLVQYPATDGRVLDYSVSGEGVHAFNCLNEEGNHRQESQGKVWNAHTPRSEKMVQCI